MVFKKYSKVSNATNKTISEGKFHGIFHGAIHAHWGLFWQGAEMIKAVIVLIFISKTLYDRVGYSFLVIPICIFAKIMFDKYTRVWRESARRYEHKVGDKRRNELNMSLKNIKTVKLYAW